MRFRRLKETERTTLLTLDCDFVGTVALSGAVFSSVGARAFDPPMGRLDKSVEDFGAREPRRPKERLRESMVISC